MSEPTERQIKKEITLLQEIKPKIRAFSLFGDDNRAKIDAQIHALEERVAEDDIWDIWPEEEGPDASMRENALYAIQWLEGKDDEAPSSGWKPLIES